VIHSAIRPAYGNYKENSKIIFGSCTVALSIPTAKDINCLKFQYAAIFSAISAQFLSV